MKYVTIDNEGKATGFFDPSAHGTKGQEGSKVPDTAFEISDEQWSAWYPAQSTKRWIEGGLVDVPEPLYVPQIVTPLQARKALRLAGLKEAVDAAIANQSEEVREEWDYAISVERTNPILIGVAQGLGLTDTDLDNLFIQASQL